MPKAAVRAGVPVYRPTREQWARGLDAYVREVIEPSDGARVGLCKIIPPPGWAWASPRHQETLKAAARVSNVNRRRAVPAAAAGAGAGAGAGGGRDGLAPTAAPRIVKPIRQLTSGMRGAFRLDFVWTKPLSVAAYEAKAHTHAEACSAGLRQALRELSGQRGVNQPVVSPRGAGPPCTPRVTAAEPPQEFTSDTPEPALDTVERAFWRSLGSMKRPAEYGADQLGTLFGDERAGGWSVNHIDSLLQAGMDALGMGDALAGVAVPMLYFGMWRSCFAWHVEDLDLSSINYLHFGAPKVWYGVRPGDDVRLEAVARAHFGEESLRCPQFLRHKNLMLSPSVLRAAGVRVASCVQRPGEFMLTFPRAYHAGFNTGFNCAESVNLATPSWLPFARRACWCLCAKTTVRLNVDALVDAVRHFHPGRLPDAPAPGDRVMVRWPGQPGWRLVRLRARRPGASELVAAPTTLVCADATGDGSDTHVVVKGRRVVKRSEPPLDFDPAVTTWRWVTPADQECPAVGDHLAMRWLGFPKEYLVQVVRARGRGLAVRSAVGEPGFGEWPFDHQADWWRRLDPDEEAAVATIASTTRMRPRSTSDTPKPRQRKRQRMKWTTADAGPHTQGPAVAALAAPGTADRQPTPTRPGSAVG